MPNVNKLVYHQRENAPTRGRSMDNCGIKPENPFGLLLTQKNKGQQVKVSGLPMKGINKETMRCLDANCNHHNSYFIL